MHMLYGQEGGGGGYYGVHACTCSTIRKGPESGEGRTLTKQ